MNYPESQLILDEIKKAKRILVNCHRSPDPDSVGSALSIYHALQLLGKSDIKIICPDEAPFNCKFLDNSEKIEKVDFSKFNFSEHDLFMIVDSGNWDQVTGKKNVLNSNIKKIVIDHHYTNSKFGDLNILDIEAGSTAAIIAKLVEDFNLSIDGVLATSLLTGIIADTLSFQTDVIGNSSLIIADRLIKAGADRNNVIFNLNRSKSLDEIHLIGYLLSNIKVEKEYGFAWVAVSKEISRKFPMSKDAKSSVAGSFIPAIESTDFGFVLEESDRYISVSFRTRQNFDVSKIAEELGGGGHKSAAAARLPDLNFTEAVEKVLNACRKYAIKKV